MLSVLGYCLAHERLQKTQPLQNPRAREIVIHLVVENDREQRKPEHRSGPHFLNTGQSLQVGGKRISDLIFDNLRRFPRVAGANNDLHIRQIRQRIQRCTLNRP